METLGYEHQPVASFGWGAVAVAIAATALLALDLAELHSPAGDGDVGRATYSAIVAAGATMRSTEPETSLPIANLTHPAEVVALSDDTPNE